METEEELRHLLIRAEALVIMNALKRALDVEIDRVRSEGKNPLAVVVASQVFLMFVKDANERTLPPESLELVNSVVAETVGQAYATTRQKEH